MVTAGNFDGLSPQFETDVVLPARTEAASARRKYGIVIIERIVVTLLSYVLGWILFNPSLNCKTYTSSHTLSNFTCSGKLALVFFRYSELEA